MFKLSTLKKCINGPWGPKVWAQFAQKLYYIETMITIIISSTIAIIITIINDCWSILQPGVCKCISASHWPGAGHVKLIIIFITTTSVIIL